MSVSKEGKQLAAVVSCWPCRGFAVSPRADRCTSRSCPDFGQKSTPNHPRITVELFALSARQKPVELVMRGPAVVLAAALLWLISIGGAEAKLDVLVDKATQRMLVIQNGYIRYMWPVSTGRDNMATPNGVYTPQRLERNWFSTAYYDSPMPYSIFFHKGYAIHGSYAINRLGGPASHGCVRLHPHHAALLFDLVQQEGPDKTTIEVTDEGRPEGPSLPGREIPPGQGLSPPAPPVPLPRVIRYREAGDMPELPPPQLGNRLIARSPLPPPRPVFASRYMPADVRPPLTDVKPPASLPPASVLRARSGARDVDTANRAQRASNEPPDSRSKTKVAEAAPPEKTQQAASVPAQQSASSFRLLPTSCWSGGASRWRWWASSERTPCR